MKKIQREAYTPDDWIQGKYLKCIKDYVEEEIRPKQTPNSPYMSYEQKRKEEIERLKQSCLNSVN